MNILNYLHRKGINTLDASFYRRIEEWNGWYAGNVKNFSTYRIYSGQGTYSRKRRKSLGMAKKLSEDIADLLLNERVKIVLSDAATDEFVRQVLTDNRFEVLGNEYQERKAYTGTVAYVPFLEDAEIAEDGSFRNGTVGINFISAANIHPVSWVNGNVTECVFAFPKTVNRKKYVHIQYHRIVSGKYAIENNVLEVSDSSNERELTEAEWRQIQPFRGLVARIETGSDQPQFVIDRLNIVNNADADESNPMGVAIFANEIDLLRATDTIYDSYGNEFDLGRKRIFVAPEMVKNNDGSPAFDPDDSIFYLLPEGYEGEDDKKAKPIQEINMELRAEQHSKAINDNLNYLSLKCGFGTERYKFEAGSVKTATEVISVNSDMYRTIKKHEIILGDALTRLIRVIVRLGNVTGHSLSEDCDITIQFDDSIVEDKAAERTSDRADVAMGAMPLYEYRVKWYAETEDEAKAKVMLPEVIE